MEDVWAVVNAEMSVQQMFLKWWRARPRQQISKSAPNAACVWVPVLQNLLPTVLVKAGKLFF
jgi:hypothetical protein